MNEQDVQAVRKFNNTAPGTYDAILMDIQMPGMNAHVAKPIDVDVLRATLGKALTTD